MYLTKYRKSGVLRLCYLYPAFVQVTLGIYLSGKIAYLILSPGGSIGPWHVMQLLFSATSQN
jgi:hypothetical protein